MNKGGSAFGQCGKNFECYDKTLLRLPLSSKGFCKSKNAFPLPPLIFTAQGKIRNEQLAIRNEE
jgi:hypothetical protein